MDFIWKPIDDFMKQKKYFTLGIKIMSEGHRDLQMAIKQGLGNQHQSKTEEKLQKALRIKLSEQWQDYN